MASFRFRLTLLNAAVLGCVLLAVVLLLRWQLGGILRERLDASILAMAEAELASSTDSPDGTTHLHPIPPRPGYHDIAPINKIVALVDAAGRVLDRLPEDSADDLRIPTDLLSEVGRSGPVFRSVAARRGDRVRFVGLPIEIDASSDGVLLVGASMRGLEDLLGLLDLLLFGVTALGLAAAAGAGYFLARKALRPVGHIVAQAEAIGSESAGKRLDQSDANDEMAELTRVLNRMLDRIQQGVESQRRFTSDASHEIRTPLSNLRGTIEVCLRRPRPPSEYRETLESGLEEVNRLTSLVDGLLTVTRVQHASGSLQKVAVDLAALVGHEVDRRAADARRRRLDLRAQLDGSLTIQGNPALLGRLVANLLENSIKYCRADDRIVVRLGRSDSAAVVCVEDTGPGISPEEQKHVCERFFRGGTGRSSDPSGAGLGLPICQLIAELHGGALQLTAEEGAGTTVSVTLSLR